MLIINKLEIKNFIQFQGLNSLDFEQDSKKPFNVIFGGNGVGKSGIIKAIKWVLFGKTQDKGFDGDTKFLNLLNREAARNKDFEILVKLKITFENSEYIIKRIKTLKLGIVNFSNERDLAEDSFEIQRGGILIPENDRLRILRNLISEDMTIFNFIQGEEIHKYYSDENNKIKQCIEASLKLPELDKIVKLIKLIEIDYLKELKAAGVKDKDKELLFNFKTTKTKLEQNIEDLNLSIKNDEEKIQKFSDRFKKQEETIKKLQVAEKEKDQLKDKINDLKVLLHEEVPHIWKHILKSDINDFITSNPIKFPVLAKDLSVILKKALNSKECPICNKTTNDVIAELNDKLQILENSNNSSDELSINLDRIMADLPNNSYRQNASEYEKYKLELDLVQIDTFSNNQIDEGDFEDYEKASERNNRYITIIIRKKDELETSVKELKDIVQKIKIQEAIVAASSGSQTELESKMEKAENYKSYFEKIKENLISDTKTKVEIEANNIYSQLIDNDLYILKINNDYKLEMYEKSFLDKPLEISTGQSVIIMYSLIYAFRKVANFEGVLFIDNIFPNLSDEISYKTIDVISKIFNHVILVQLTSSKDLTNKIVEKSKRVFNVERKNSSISFISARSD